MKLNCTRCKVPFEAPNTPSAVASCPACGTSFRLEDNRLIDISEDPTLTFLVTTTRGELRAMVESSGHQEIDSSCPPGRVLQERYVLECELGRGGMGQVFLARDTRLNRPVAIKVMLPSVDGRVGNETSPQEKQLRARFAEEARIGANLVHPAIAAVFDFGFDGTTPFTVFEYVPGETLQDVLRRRKKLPLDEVRLIVAPLAQALDFAHGQHVVHRDFKPANIRATPQGQFKIVDLGLAKEFRTDVDWTAFAGTPAYASPEQAAGLPVDGRTDLYALALIAYEMLTGQRPFQSADAMEMLRLRCEEEPPSAKTVAPDLSDSVCTALLQAMHREPNQRFTTCSEFAVALGCQFLSGPAPLPEILAEGDAADESGFWPLKVLLNDRMRLVLVHDALWIDDGEVLERCLLENISLKQKKEGKWDKNAHLEIASGSSAKPRQLHFSAPEECRKWWERIVCERGTVRTSAPETQPANVQRSVVLVRHRPNLRYQILGPAEAQDEKRWSANAALRIRACLMGADAVVEVQEERLPSLDRTLRRVFGTAVRAVDQAGLLELKTRWFDAELVRLSFWMWSIVAVTFVFSLLTLWGFSPARLFVSSGNSALVEGPSAVIEQMFFSGLLPAIAVCGWPSASYLFLRLLRWPQLMPAFAIALFTSGIAPLVQSIAYLVASADHLHKPPGGTNYFTIRALIAVVLLVFWFGYFPASKTWNAYQGFRKALLEAKRRSSRFRNVISTLTVAASIALIPVCLFFEGWTGYVSGHMHEMGATYGFRAQWNVPVLINGLKHSSTRIREWAAQVLGETGTEGHPAISALEEALRDGDERVRRNATAALARIPKPAMAGIEVLNPTSTTPLMRPRPKWLGPTRASRPASEDILSILRSDSNQIRIKLLLQNGEYAKAAQMASKTSPIALSHLSSDLYYSAACLARCAALARKDEKLTEPERLATAQRYADQAVVYLRQAVDAGHKDFNRIKKDPDLDAIRDHPGYKELVERRP